jgi:hypothetical protein
MPATCTSRRQDKKGSIMIMTIKTEAALLEQPLNKCLI